ncbi:MAG: hypothetical protein U1F83_00505 [Verrucomicrobiota bacterium]
MTTDQIANVQELAGKLSKLSEQLDDQSPSNLYLSTKAAVGQPLAIIGNEDGLVYLASVLLSLAKERSEGQHYHIDDTTAQSEGQQALVFMYSRAPWQLSS